ncbi:hypothetical protein niasHT_019321 [Heterodera trifolii]|uniref:Uncharacterized protein n=1 Tax=Heterodera trifolii TaxID=157864 RepID=A0ABD2L5F7_9BILA
MASLNTTEPSETELFLLFFGGAVELITTLVGIPLSIANLILVARTSVIHPNMKAILIFQSFFILLRGSCRFVICLFKFITWDLIGAKYVQFFPTLIKMYFIGIYARNFVPHVLIVERILATLFVQTYEKNRGHLFTFLWTPFALIIPIYIAFSTSLQNGQNQPITNLITTAVQLVIGSIEKLLMSDGEATEMGAEFEKPQHYLHHFDQQNKHDISNRRGQRSVDDCPDCFDPDFVYNDDSISSSAQNSKNASQNLKIFCHIIVIIVIGIVRNGIFI